jgi:hypothetical protein
MSLAIAALIGLAFVGQSVTKETSEPETETYDYNTTTRREKETAKFNTSDVYDIQQRNIGNKSFFSKIENRNLADITDSGSRYTTGAPVYDISSREYVTNKMNNLNPNPWTRVGPGMGVGPNVPAYGGYQQLFRVLPTNTNEHRLTQLPGRFVAPPGALVSEQALPSIVQKNRPEKEYSVITGGPNKVIKTAPPGRPIDVRGSRHVTRETYQSYVERPTWKLNDGYKVTKQSQLLHTRDNRSNPDRPGNPGSMNVRDGPLNAGGMVTSVRIDDNSVPVNHGGMTNLVYGDIGIQETNQFKGNENPNIDTLDTAKNQLTDNPYNFFLGKE